MAAIVVSSGTSSCTSTMSASRRIELAASTSAGVSRPLAPGTITIEFSPLCSTVTMARPLAQSGVVNTCETSTPFSCRPVRSRWPKASSPTRPIIVTAAPGRAAAPAWLAPLPPGTSRTSWAEIVSPGRGSRAQRTTRSALIEPTTAIRARAMADLPVHHKAAVDVDCLAGDVLGPIGREEDDHVGDGFGRLPLAKRDDRADFAIGPFFVREVLGRRRLIVPGLPHAFI